MVHSVLSKNAFNTERAVTDLASKYEKRIIGSYDEWLEQKNNSNKTTSEIDTLTEGQVNLKEKLKFSNLKRKEPPTDRLPSSGLTKKRGKIWEQFLFSRLFLS